MMLSELLTHSTLLCLLHPRPTHWSTLTLCFSLLFRLIFISHSTRDITTAREHSNKPARYEIYSCAAERERKRFFTLRIEFSHFYLSKFPLKLKLNFHLSHSSSVASRLLVGVMSDNNFSFSHLCSERISTLLGIELCLAQLQQHLHNTAVQLRWIHSGANAIRKISRRNEIIIVVGRAQHQRSSTMANELNGLLHGG